MPSRTAVQLRCFLQEIRHRRRLHLEGERAILIGGDDHRDRGVLLDLLGLRVECLAELHDVEAALTQGWPDRGRRVGGAGRHLQFEESSDFFLHLSLLLVVRILTVGDRLTSHAAMNAYFIASLLARTPAPPGWRGRRSTPPPSRASALRRLPRRCR